MIKVCKTGLTVVVFFLVAYSLFGSLALATAVPPPAVKKPSRTVSGGFCKGINMIQHDLIIRLEEKLSPDDADVTFDKANGFEDFRLLVTELSHRQMSRDDALSLARLAIEVEATTGNVCRVARLLRLVANQPAMRDITDNCKVESDGLPQTAAKQKPLPAGAAQPVRIAVLPPLEERGNLLAGLECMHEMGFIDGIRAREVCEVRNMMAQPKQCAGQSR